MTEVKALSAPIRMAPTVTLVVRNESFYALRMILIAVLRDSEPITLINDFLNANAMTDMVFPKVYQSGTLTLTVSAYDGSGNLVPAKRAISVAPVINISDEDFEMPDDLPASKSAEKESV
eukprot:m.18816 g.18816  ORF g.18816 m.18816 type:complete len:120 (+) comp3373_c0_seq1:123-482(+)